jgi:hypothetical protein
MRHIAPDLIVSVVVVCALVWFLAWRPATKIELRAIKLLLRLLHKE